MFLVLYIVVSWWCILLVTQPRWCGGEFPRVVRLTGAASCPDTSQPMVVERRRRAETNRIHRESPLPWLCWLGTREKCFIVLLKCKRSDEIFFSRIMQLRSIEHARSGLVKWFALNVPKCWVITTDMIQQYFFPPQTPRAFLFILIQCVPMVKCSLLLRYVVQTNWFAHIVDCHIHRMTRRKKINIQTKIKMIIILRMSISPTARIKYGCVKLFDSRAFAASPQS